MSTNKELLETIKQLIRGLSETISDAELQNNPIFYKESIKLSALNIYDKAQLLSVHLNTEKTIPLPVVEPTKHELVQAIPDKKEFALSPEIVTEKIVEIKTQIVKPSETVVITQKTEPKKAEKIIPKQQQENIEEEDNSLNAKIAKVQQPVVNVADKLKDTPIKELVKAIPISKKFEFINGLFNGNVELYKAGLVSIENCSDYQSAANFIAQNIAEKFDWEENEPLAAEFFALVKRRFL